MSFPDAFLGRPAAEDGRGRVLSRDAPPRDRAPLSGSRPIRVTPPPPGPRWLRCSGYPATKAPHNKLASNALVAPAFPHPATVLVAVKTKPAAAGAAGLDGHLRAAARALRRVGAEGWLRSNKRIGPCRRPGSPVKPRRLAKGFSGFVLQREWERAASEMGSKQDL